MPRLPLAHALVNALDGGEGVEPQLVVEGAAAQVIDDGNLDTRVVGHPRATCRSFIRSRLKAAAA